MALTSIADAEAVNTLFHALLGEPRQGFHLPEPEDVKHALAALADAAYKKYGAGCTGEHVLAAWPGREGSPLRIAVEQHAARTAAAAAQAADQATGRR